MYYKVRQKRAGSSPAGPVTLESRHYAAASARYKGGAPRRLGYTQEVDSAVQAPDQRYAQGQEWLHFGAIPHKGPYEVERHAGEIRNEPEQRYRNVPDKVELRMFVKGHHADNATQTIEQECAEVGCERHR